MYEGDLPLRSVVYEDEDVELDRNHYLTPAGRELGGPGSLDTMLVIADAPFAVRVETRSTTLVDDDFERLSSWSDELEHISAYQPQGGEYVISISNFPYRRAIRAQILTDGDVTASWIRAVYTVGREVDV